MAMKSISSTDAQNNFGQVLNDAAQNKTRYIIERRGVPQAVILDFDDLVDLLSGEVDGQQIHSILIEMKPQYTLGRILDTEIELEQR